MLDFIFPLIRNKYFWIPLYVLCISWIIYNHRVRHVLMILLFLGLSIFATDTISSQLIKYKIQRPRPCQLVNMDPPVIERVACGSGYSFTSSHAANHFCVAAFAVTVFGHYLKRWRYLCWLWALLVGLAQIYVGVHYPLDILGGGILGVLIGIPMGILCKHQMKEARAPINQSITNSPDH